MNGVAISNKLPIKASVLPVPSPVNERSGSFPLAPLKMEDRLVNMPGKLFRPICVMVLPLPSYEKSQLAKVAVPG